MQSVSEDHLTYYEVITKAILGSDNSVVKVSLLIIFTRNQSFVVFCRMVVTFCCDVVVIRNLYTFK